MTLLGASAAGLLTAASRVVCGLVIVKVIAVSVGPSGTALVAQLQGIVSAAAALAGAGIGQGLIKYVAQSRPDRLGQRRIVGTATLITLVGATVVGLALWYASRPLAGALLGSEGHALAIALAGVAVVPLAFNTLLQSILNGHKELWRVTVSMVAASLAAMSLQLILAPSLGLPGALAAAAIGQAPALAVTAALFLAASTIDKRALFAGGDWRSAGLLGRYAVMTATTAVVVPVSQIAVREFLMHEISPEAAGIWHGLTRISEVYLLVVTQALSLYYLPRLAETDDKAALRAEIGKGLRLFVPMAGVCAGAVYLFREPLVGIVFSDAFLPMAQLFAPQLIGDVIKIGSYLFAMLMLAKSMTAFYVISEVLFSLLFVAVAVVMVKWLGLVGMPYAHALVFLAYFVTLAVRMRRVLF